MLTVSTASMASPRVFDVGIGVFILAVLWASCCLLCIFLSKTQGISRTCPEPPSGDDCCCRGGITTCPPCLEDASATKTVTTNRAVGVFAATLMATVLLLILPLGEGQKLKGSDITDPLFIWRSALTVLLGMCALASPMIMIKVHWSVPVQARSLNRLNNIIRRRTVGIQTSEEQL